MEGTAASENTLKSQIGLSVSSMVDIINIKASNIKNYASKFQMTDAKWEFCHSTFVFCLGVVVTKQLKKIVHEFL